MIAAAEPGQTPDASRTASLAAAAATGDERAFAELTFPDENYVFQWWSPYVPWGARLNAFKRIQEEWAEEGRTFELIANEDYTARIGELIDRARATSSTTNEPAFRMLQVLTRLRGAKPAL